MHSLDAKEPCTYTKMTKSRRADERVAPRKGALVTSEAGFSGTPGLQIRSPGWISSRADKHNH